jgi:Bor protein
VPCVSCVAHEHVVGLGPTGTSQTTVRQYYVFFGLVRLNEINAQNIANNLTSYTVESEFSFMDLLLFPVMLPLTVTSRTVTVKT